MYLRKITFGLLCFVLVVDNLLALPIDDIVVDYDGYSVFFIKTETLDENQIVVELIRDSVQEINIWNTKKSLGDGLEITISVPPYLRKHTIEILQKNGIESNILIENVKKVFENERNNQLHFVEKKRGYISFDHYYRHGEINDYLDRLGRDYPHLVEVIYIGDSYENRTIKLIKVSASDSSSSSNPAILIEGGIHAREWIAPAQVLYIINQLVENYQNNSELLKNLDWYLMPVLNPDGYEYTHEKDRLWRRTRSKVIDVPFFSNYMVGCRLTATPCSCKGVDGNRNWDIYWDGSPDNDGNEIVVGNGMHSNGHIPCLDDYGGPKPFSEIEVKQLSDFAKKIRHQIKLYLSFHSFGNEILYPYGYTTELPNNVDELDNLGHLVAESMEIKYGVGSSANTLYGITGGSSDYFHDRLKVGLSYTIELPGGGESGFDLPPNRIHHVVSDMFKGVRTFANYVENKFVRTR